jgi:hypothetical protein
MKVETTHPDTGETIVLDVPNLTDEQIRDMAREYSTDKQLQSKLDNLPLSAEGKVFLAKFLKFTLKVGRVAIKLGKKLIEIAIFVVTKLNHLTFWTVLGAVIAFMVSMIPLIGVSLGGFLGPIIMLGGLVKGFYEQIKSSDPSIVDIIDNSTVSFRPLNRGFA